MKVRICSFIIVSSMFFAQSNAMLYTHKTSEPSPEAQTASPIINKLIKMYDPLNKLIDTYQLLHDGYMANPSDELKEKLEKIQSMVITADKTIHALIESLKKQTNDISTTEQEQILAKLQKTMIKAYAVIHNHPIDLNEVPENAKNKSSNCRIATFAKYLGVAAGTALLCYLGYKGYKYFKQFKKNKAAKDDPLSDPDIDPSDCQDLEEQKEEPHSTALADIAAQLRQKPKDEQPETTPAPTQARKRWGRAGRKLHAVFALRKKTPRM